jgi:integrase
MMDSKAIDELMLVEAKLDELLPHLGKHRIEELQRHIAKHFVRRFAGKRKTCKYGRLSKGFNEFELQKFFASVSNKKLLLLWKYQATLALRIGEVCKLNIKDFNLETRELKIVTEKAKIWDSLIVPQGLFQETLNFINYNKAQIEDSGGFIFYAEKKKSTRDVGYLSSDYVKVRFREFILKSGVDEVYGVSDETKGRSVRRLHRLSSHSLRHYAITKFARETKDLVLASRYARHASPDTTMTYISTDKSQLYQAIEQTSSLKEAILLKGRVK